MDPRMWHRVAALSGVAALALGTYGAHVFKPKNPAYKDVWHTASLYHLVHTSALLATPLTKYPNVMDAILQFRKFLVHCRVLAASFMSMTWIIPTIPALKADVWGFVNHWDSGIFRIESHFHGWVRIYGGRSGYRMYIIVAFTVAFMFSSLWNIISMPCYAAAYLEDRKYSFFAPYGGFAFIGAWASLLF